MTLEQRKQQVAHGQIHISIQRLAEKYPFHAKVLERFDLRAQPDVGTMGVTVVGGMIRLVYSPDFVLAISADELAGVLLHEVHHVVFNHVLAEPADYPDEWARTVAEEVTVNEFINEPLPGQPITLAQFPKLPALESTKRRYGRLKRQRRHLPTASFQLVIPITGGASCATTTPEQGRASSHGRSLLVVDNHSVWQEAMANRNEAQATIRRVLHDAISDVGIERVPQHLRKALQELCQLQPQLGHGDSPGNEEYKMQGNAHGHLAWVQLLRRYIGNCLTVSPDFSRPARRFPELVGIVPGKRRRGARPTVLAVIDTSGSVTPELLELINAELGRLADTYSVTVVECDTAIHRVYRYRPIREVLGRGGTDLCPPFEPAFLRKRRPDLIIYFTDGEGPAPEKSPRLPVIWCLTPKGNPPCSWGRVVYMEPTEPQKCLDVD